MRALVACLAALPYATTDSSQAVEEFARRQFESGVAFLAAGKYTEALKDFDAVVSRYPSSAVADDAMLEIVRYHLEIADDVAAARAAADALLQNYPSSDSAPVAHVMSGRILLSARRSPADIDTALASYERVARLFPDTAAVPMAIYHAGEALWLGKRFPQALERFRQVATDYPRSPWAARALVGAGRSRVLLDQPLRAIEDFQRVRLRFPDSPEAEIALSLNTILYRLYVRPPAYPSYVFSGRVVPATGKLPDVSALGITAGGVVFAGTRRGLIVYDPSGKQVTAPIAGPVRSLFFTRRTEVIVAARGTVQGQRDPIPVSLAVPKPDGTTRLLEEIPAAVGLSTGDYVVVDKNGRGLARFSTAGKHVGSFAALEAERLAVNTFDDVAALTKDGKGVTVLDQDGARLTHVPARGAGYEMKDAVDVAYDSLGHMYVLDRGRGAVLIFGAKGTLVTVFAPDTSSGAFREARALALDLGGRLYVYDGRSERVNVYQ
jgi:TolA-binding protein